VLIFVLQASSAAFTPTFQATLPDLLPQEGDYTKALSLSRMASAALLVSVVMPPPPAPQHRSIYDQTTRGLGVHYGMPVTMAIASGDELT
jgi:hypothetical protein